MGRIYFKDNFILPKVIKKIIFLIDSHIKKLNYNFIKTKLVIDEGNIIAEDYFTNRIHFKKKDVAINVRANQVDLYLYFFYRNFKINYIGIEPSLVELSNLKYNCYNIKLFNYAAHQQYDSKINFYVSSE